ncbi:MAG: MarR family winged helix-turn-helix transcriptional regulator [Sciscionella sp.]
MPNTDLSTHPGHLVRRMQQVHNLLWTTMASSTITSPQFAVLNALAEKPDSDQRTLGRMAWLDRSTAADVIARLVRRGLITRVRDDADGRRNVLRLSEAGHDAHHALVRRTAGMNELFLSPLSGAERTQLIDLLNRVVTAGERLRAADIQL